jgi:hypothetical protein
MVAVTFTRDEHDAASLRRAASSSRDAEAARRMLALALIVDGQPRSEAAKLCGMDRQTLRDWVHRYNAEALAGLSDRRGAVGPKPPVARADGGGGRVGACRPPPGPARRVALAAGRPRGGDRHAFWGEGG